MVHVFVWDGSASLEMVQTERTDERKIVLVYSRQINVSHFEIVSGNVDAQEKKTFQGLKS